MTHPSLHFGPFRIPALFIPLVSVWLPLVVRPQSLSHYLSRPAFKRQLGGFLGALHLLFYTCTVSGILSKEGLQENDVAVPLLSYTTLMVGEAIHRTSTFWSYTSIAVGWVLICPEAPLNETLSPSTRAWMALLISVFSTLRTDEQLSTGAMVSALALFTRTIYHIWIVSSVSPVS
jgi:hypothetical protein